MRALITGIAGFVGSHLAEELLANGHEVAGIALPDHPTENIKDILDRIKMFPADILDLQSLKKTLVSFAPDVVFHLAAISFVPEAEGAPKKLFEVNVIGTINLLETTLAMQTPPMFVFVSSSEIYEPTEFALVEDTPAKPRNLYAVSKYAAELFIEHHQNLKPCIFRPFNHIGPRQRPAFAVSNFARQIALMERGKNKLTLQVGNIESARDFTDVRDIVRAYRIAAEKGASGTYNLCSGTVTKIKTVIGIFKSLAKVKFNVHVKREFLRQRETLKSFGSYAKAKEAFGWEPKISLKKSLADTLDYWRARV